jgi:PAS domain-containing protein
MAAVMFDAYSLEDFRAILESGAPYPYYAVLLYPPLNGLNAKLHRYVLSHWRFLNSLTGDNCLLLAIESRDKPIDKFKPGDVYAIARLLGAEVDQIPCLIFITDPNSERQTLVQPLGALFGESEELTDERLTEFFQGVQAIIDRCAKTSSSDNRFECLHRTFTRRYVFPKQRKKAFVLVIQILDTVSQVLQPIASILSSVR